MTETNVAGGGTDNLAGFLVNRLRFGEPLPDGAGDFVVATIGGFEFGEQDAVALALAETEEVASAIIRRTNTSAPVNLESLAPRTAHGQKIRQNLKATRRKR
jgi:hypothetical protein